jgi:DNA replication protein DnaC
MSYEDCLKIARHLFPDLVDTPQEWPATIRGCSHCGGVGYIHWELPVGHEWFGRLIPCLCRLRRMREKRLAAARMLNAVEQLTGVERRTLTFDTLERWGDPADWATMQRAIDAAKRFVARPGRWLTLIGEPGCGKTHLAVAIVNALLEQNLAVMYAYSTSIADALRRAVKGEGPQPITDALGMADVLVIDDLGVEQDTDYLNTQYDHVINTRYKYRTDRPTIVTTNLPTDELRARNSRIASRILDRDLVTVCPITLGDYRARPGGERVKGEI